MVVEPTCTSSTNTRPFLKLTLASVSSVSTPTVKVSTLMSSPYAVMSHRPTATSEAPRTKFVDGESDRLTTVIEPELTVNALGPNGNVPVARTPTP